MAVCIQCVEQFNRHGHRQNQNQNQIVKRSFFKNFSKKSYLLLILSHLLFMWIGSRLASFTSNTSRLMSSPQAKTIPQCSSSSNPVSPYSIAYVTITDLDQATQMAEKLVSRKLAGCVNISPKVTSIYQWKGKIQRDDESLMMIKTRTALVPELIEFVKANHPYQVCEVITIPIQHGNPQYLDWLEDCLKKDGIN